MKLKDIAVFKHFIANKDLRRQYIRGYNVSKSFANNPNLIEDYFEKVDPLTVITKAIRVCRPNDTYGYDFWQSLNEEWITFYNQMQSSNFYQHVDENKSIDGYLGILRENWNDSQKPWCWEPRRLARIRLGLAPEEADNTTSDVRETPNEDKEEQQPLVDFVNEDEDPLADFDFFDDVLPGQYRLKSNEISVNFNKGNKITFNQVDSKVIRESGLKFARLAKSKNDDICLIINCYKGATLTNLSGRNGNLNATINSVDICGKLRTLFSLKSDYSILRVEKLQAAQEFIIYKITKQ